jgi:hypothetical protein
MYRNGYKSETIAIFSLTGVLRSNRFAQVERRLREKIQSQLPAVGPTTANQLIELRVRGESEQGRLRSLLAPYGLVKEMTLGKEEEGEEGGEGEVCLNIIIFTTPDAALSACTGTVKEGDLSFD